MTRLDQICTDIKFQLFTLTFNLDRAEYMNFGMPGLFETTAAMPAITGAFVFNGETLATGNFSGGYAGEASTYQMTLAAVPQEIPEPATTLGIGSIVGLGGLFQRKSSAPRKNQKQA